MLSVMPTLAPERPRVALLVTCLADLFRPRVGWAAVALLRNAGCEVEVPAAQTCCGQPAYNSGHKAEAEAIARQVIAAFESYTYVVVPSGSCGGMVRKHYPELFADDPGWASRASALAERTYELTSFLVEVLGVEKVEARFPAKVAYHDSCSSLRELGIQEQPRKLLRSVADLKLADLAEPGACCGFGGTFCVKYPAISERMVDDKLDDIVATGADTLLAADLGCLLNIAGRARRRGKPLRVLHVAEVLAGMVDGAGIGDPEPGK